MGDDVSGLSSEQAKRYLDLHPNGTLHNDIFDTDSFITKDRNGGYVFFHGVADKIDQFYWHDLDDIAETPQEKRWLEDWWYHPGDQMEVTNGGQKFWSEVRSGKYSSTSQIP